MNFYNKTMSKSQFYFFSFTWGILMSLIGCLVSGILLLCGYKPIKNQYSWSIPIGKGWGGLELGLCSIVCEDYNQHLLNHEFGHSLQNCYFGPFMIFISIASAIRFWYREFLKAKYKIAPAYDSIWFEGTASYLGDYYYKVMKEDNNEHL